MRPSRLFRQFTLIELLVVTAIIAVLASISLAVISTVRTRAMIAESKAQLRLMAMALAVYESEANALPRDPANLFGADIPEFLYAGLNNRPLASLGGAPTIKPPYDPEARLVGILNGEDDSAPRDDAVPTATPIDTKLSRHSLSFQRAHKVRKRRGDSIVEAKGLPVYVDPWGNAYHYREWNSKSRKDKLAPNLRCHAPESFEIWSNGPDGIDDKGVEGSDDIRSWAD